MGFVLLVFLGVVVGLQLDIHVVPNAAVNEIVYSLASRSPHNQINFTTENDPHITLYLTDFEDSNVGLVVSAVQNALDKKFSSNCLVAMKGMSVGAGYAMWNVDLDSCLQQLSDSVVLATFQYAKKNQSIPPWVYSLPPAERDAKIAMMKKYGSPNVFSQFEPHLTIAYDTQDNLSSIYGADTTSSSFEASLVSISRVGPFGTVIKGSELINITLGSPKVDTPAEYCRPSSSDNWDYFLLVREWPGTMTPGPLPNFINTFTLHGLWPNRNDGSWPQCCNSSYPFDYEEIAPIITSVERVWYDTMHDQQNASSFWGHEWDKHGTCWAGSNGTEFQYFEICINLHDAMPIVAWLAQGGITPADPSQTLYNRTSFVAAIQAGLGHMPLLKCTNLAGNTVIENIGVCVGKNLQVIDCPANQIASWANDENCGSSFGMPTIPH